MTAAFKEALTQLIVIPRRVLLRATEDHGIGSVDRAEAMDAAHEDADGRLPHDPPPN